MAVHPIEYRYYTQEMKKIWSEEHKLALLLRVEAALAKAHAKLGNIPKEAAEEIAKKANLKYVSLEEVKAEEAKIKHDIMAMVRVLARKCGEYGKYVHLGATSYDIVDCALALQFKESINIIESRLKKLKNILLSLAEKYKDLVCIGRTHGQHALPTTYGLKFAIFAYEIHRHIERLNEAKKRVICGKMSGAVGTQAGFGKHAIKLQELVAKDLGINYALVSNQIVQRDRHAEIIFILALIASTLDKIFTEIRNLQRTEIAEVFEYFEKESQVGSSTMPHKRNPWRSERICGIARIIRGFVVPALENIVLWHERDLTNSSCERVTFPEVFVLTDFILKEAIDILSKIEIDKENVKKNLFLLKGLNMAEAVMIKLVEKGMGRQEAHELLRKLAIEAYEGKKEFKEVLLRNKVIRKYLSEKEIEEALNPYNYIGTAIEQVDRLIKKLK